MTCSSSAPRSPAGSADRSSFGRTIRIRTSLPTPTAPTSERWLLRLIAGDSRIEAERAGSCRQCKDLVPVGSEDEARGDRVVEAALELGEVLLPPIWIQPGELL